MSKAVGKDGKLAERASFGPVGGAWAREVESVNTLITDLARPTMEIARVIGAVAKGDLTQAMILEVDGKAIQGEFVRTAKIVNTMVDQLNAFAGEVTRVAREVGTEGKTPAERQAAYRQLFKHHIDTPISFATTSTAALAACLASR